MSEKRKITSPRDLAGKNHWEGEWQRKGHLGSVNLKNYSHWRFDMLFTRYLDGNQGKKLIEIGCARSVWLPYFHLKFGCEIYGLDYSSKGCILAEENLKRHNAKGTIFCRNVFDENKDLQNYFDVVFSYGVVEHFDPVVPILKQFNEFCISNGKVITVIPNMNGFVGSLQRWVHRTTYDKHMVIDDRKLRTAHEEAGFETLECHYMGSFATEVVNYPPDAGIGLRLFRKILKKITKVCWVIFQLICLHPESKRFSPYIIYVGTKNSGLVH